MPRTHRHKNINYTQGLFFVTTQVAHNKSIFGVIAGDSCQLNQLGRQVEAHWRSLFQYRAEFVMDAFVVMPNHFHAIIEVKRLSGKPPSHLAKAMQIFKSITATDYRKLRESGGCPDIGGALWARGYHDDLITSAQELRNMRAYIRDNPANWERDRFGPVTTYHVGNLELLNHPCIAFVASERGTASLCEAVSPGGASPPPMASLCEAVSPGGASPPPLSPCEAVALGEASPSPIISTFTSTEERAVLARCLARGRPYIHVLPRGIPKPLPAAWQRACEAGTALLISPFAPDVRLNKQRAIWCNQYVLRHASEIRHGTIQPGGTLETLLATLETLLATLSPGRASPPPKE